MAHFAVVKLLLREQKVPNMLSEVDRLGRTPFYLAAQKGNFDVLKFLCSQTFRRRPDIDARANNQSTPLIAACRNGHLECVKLLVAKGAGVESTMDRGVRPLMAATANPDQKTSVEICSFLLGNETQNAEINAVDDHNRTAFFMACQEENFPLVKFIAAHEEVDTKIACGFSYTGQEALLAKKNKEIGFWVRDLQRKRDKEKKDRIEKANRELGKKNEGPKKKQLISDDEWKIVKEFKKGGRNLDVLDVLQCPGWEKNNWARNQFDEEQATKARERKEMEEELKRAAEEEEKARKERMEWDEELRRRKKEKEARLKRRSSKV